VAGRLRRLRPEDGPPGDAQAHPRSAMPLPAPAPTPPAQASITRRRQARLAAALAAAALLVFSPGALLTPGARRAGKLIVASADAHRPRAAKATPGRPHAHLGSLPGKHAPLPSTTPLTPPPPTTPPRY